MVQTSPLIEFNYFPVKRRPYSPKRRGGGEDNPLSPHPVLHSYRAKKKKIYFDRPSYQQRCHLTGWSSSVNHNHVCPLYYKACLLSQLSLSIYYLYNVCSLRRQHLDDTLT